MKLKVSKVFANFLNKMAKDDELKIDHAEVRNFSEIGYEMNVGDAYDAECNGDYNWKTDNYKALMIVYPDNYFACPMYLTTKRITNEAKRMRVNNQDELKKMLKNLIEI